MQATMSIKANTDLLCDRLEHHKYLIGQHQGLSMLGLWNSQDSISQYTCVHREWQTRLRGRKTDISDVGNMCITCVLTCESLKGCHLEYRVSDLREENGLL